MGCCEKLKVAILFLFSLLIYTKLVMGRYVVQQGSLKVTSPESLKGTYDTAIGNFRTPNFGGSIVGAVVYPKDNNKGCKSFVNLGISLKTKHGAMPYFVLVDRGDCYFTLKVWNAQNAGAAAVLVADDFDEPLVAMTSPEERGVPPKYVAKITIPSALIVKSLGTRLKEAVNKDTMVNVTLN